VRVFCHDDSRLGLHLPIRRRVTGLGVKPLQIVEPLYESSWWYAAVDPTTGDAFWWEWSCLAADCVNLLLQKFGQPSAESLHMVLRDQAPAHVAQRVQMPANVVRVWLPASSPELHPVERLWEDLKARIDVMDARVRASLSALQEQVASMVQRSTAATIASLTGYAY
jgi:putative transposase